MPAAAHQQTRILFNRFIPSSSASRSPFTPQNPLVPPPQLAPKDELTPEKVDEHIDGAFEIAKFLRTNVVQGVRTDEGNYGAWRELAELPNVSAKPIRQLTGFCSHLFLSIRFLTVAACRCFRHTLAVPRRYRLLQPSAYTKKQNEATTTRSSSRRSSRSRQEMKVCGGGGDGAKVRRRLCRWDAVGVPVRRRDGRVEQQFATLAYFATFDGLDGTWTASGLTPAR